jgi:hypothetical protein
MKLLDNIKTYRMSQKDKKPLPSSLFGVVAVIVQQFHLKRQFLLDADCLEDSGGWYPPMAPTNRLGLFPLVTMEQMTLTQEIIEKYGNPYLIYARSPQDFKLSLLLYKSRPDLSEENLQENSLGVLWADAKPEPRL